MATTNLSDAQIRELRREGLDNFEPYWFPNEEDLDDIYVAEGRNMDQAAARLIETIAGYMAAGLGSYSAQGVSVNGTTTTAAMLQIADRKRQMLLNAGYQGG